MSSLGAFSVGTTFVSHTDGPAIHLIGLDTTNAHAYTRRILIHTTATKSKDYVSPSWLRKYHKLGRTLGCFAVMAVDFDRLQNQLSNGGFLYAGQSAIP